MHYSFIVNPAANEGRASKVWQSLKNYLDQQNIQYSYESTKEPGDAELIAAKISKSAHGQTILIAVGGDGTIDDIINGTFPTEADVSYDLAPLAVIPAGLHNNFANTRGISLDPIKAFQQIEGAQDNTMVWVGHYHEAIKDENGFFVNNFSTGLDAAILSKENSQNRHPHFFNAFFKYALAVLYDQQPFPIMVQERHHHLLFEKGYLAHCSINPNAKENPLTLTVLTHHNWLINLWSVFLLVRKRLTHSRWPQKFQNNNFHFTTTSLEFVQKDGIEIGNRFIDVTINSVKYPFHQLFSDD